MQFYFDHHNHRTGSNAPQSEAVDCRSLEEAERDCLRALCSETSDGACPYTVAAITIRDERGKALSVASIHATVHRL